MKTTSPLRTRRNAAGHRLPSSTLRRGFPALPVTAWMLFLSILLSLAPALEAQRLPCRPCAGLLVGSPAAAATAAELLKEAGGGEPLAEDSLLAVAWDVTAVPGAAAATASAAAGETLRELGAVPWVRLTFHTPPPLLENLDRLGAELEAAAAIARALPPGSFLQIHWPPLPEDPSAAREIAFLIKRASAALTGAGGGQARVVSPVLPPRPVLLEALYAEEVAAYLDAVALAPRPPRELAPAVEALRTLDPGKPLVVDSRPLPQEPGQALARAAADAAGGVDLTLFRATGDRSPVPGASAVAAFRVLAEEFAGDLEYDPYSSPGYGGDAVAGEIPGGEPGDGERGPWAFVRGEDLGLRVIAPVPPEQRQAGELVLEFSDLTLRDPARVPFDRPEPIPLAGLSRSGEALTLRVADPGPVAVLRMERPSLEELAGEGGLAEEMTVAGEREIPVEEILRRLQAFEDDQARRLEHYRAVNQTELRFQFGTATQTLETTFRGPFFFRQGEGFDWAWEQFYVNGVRWRGKSIPEIPLIRPEKAAALPVDILFDPEYRYRLRGTETVDGRQAWVVEFRPLGEVEEGRSLWQGTVWIDREVHARLRTRAVQLGLSGEVLSNEETTFYAPLDADGEETSWEDREAFVLPVRSTGQELLNILNGTSVVEKETLLSDFEINAAGFEAAREEVLASDATMVRDTEKGLRYLVKEGEGGERVVQEEADEDRIFLGGGLFHDESLDFPLPLAGINYFSFDFRDTGAQVNAFFAGALLTLDYADPSLFGSRWDAGVDANALAVRTSDQLFRDGREVPGEEVEQRVANFEATVGRPIGNFFKLSLEYGVTWRDYATADDTAADFVLPEDHFDQSLSLFGRFSRQGWRASFNGSFHSRSDWEFWGLPGNREFDSGQEDYVLWEASLGKNWYLPNFRKVGLELEYVDGEDLDRFSKYEFGFFSDVRVHGYQSDAVRAERAAALHASYGFELSELLRVDALADVAWATDEISGLDREMLAGVGIAGTFVGPWQTLVNLDLGVAVDGPDDGVSVFLVFLKLLDW